MLPILGITWTDLKNTYDVCYSNWFRFFISLNELPKGKVNHDEV